MIISIEQMGKRGRIHLMMKMEMKKHSLLPVLTIRMRMRNRLRSRQIRRDWRTMMDPMDLQLMRIIGKMEEKQLKDRIPMAPWQTGRIRLMKERRQTERMMTTSRQTERTMTASRQTERTMTASRQTWMTMEKRCLGRQMGRQTRQQMR